MTGLSSSKTPHIAAILLLTLMLGLMCLNTVHKRFSYDEPNNLDYGIRLITDGPSAPMLGQRMPVLALHALACQPFNCVTDRETRRTLTRFPSMFFALAAGALLYLWLIQLIGPKPALAGLLLYALNPNFIAHGKALTSDSATVFFTLSTLYFFWKFLKLKRIPYLAGTALSLSLGILSKYSALILLPALLLLFVIHWLTSGRRLCLPKFFSSLAIFGIIVWGVINAAYLFDGTLMKASEYKWQSKAYQKYSNVEIPLFFPKTFVEGLDYTKYLEENPQTGRGNNYILGKLHRKGRWYAYSVMVLLKTPLAFFILLILAAFRKNTKPDWVTESFIWIPFLIWMVIFSAANAQLGIRYLLPALTLPIVAAARAFQGPVSKPRKFFLIGLTAWYVLSSLSYGPHMMSYFNEVIGPRINAYKYLADSNLDWEDKKYYLDRFIAKHPEMTPMHVRPMEPVSGYVIAPANDLVGVLDEHLYDWLRLNFKPLRHITYSHYLYYVPENRLKEILAEQGTPS